MFSNRSTSSGAKNVLIEHLGKDGLMSDSKHYMTYIRAQQAQLRDPNNRGAVASSVIDRRITLRLSSFGGYGLGTGRFG